MDTYEKTALQRLEEYLKFKNIAPGKLEKMAGLANGYIRKNKGSLSSTKLADILCVLQDLNGDWLLTGRGNMLYDEEKPVDGLRMETKTQSIQVSSLDNGSQIVGTVQGDYNEQGRNSHMPHFESNENKFEINNEQKNVLEIEQKSITQFDFPTDMDGLRKRIAQLQNQLKSMEKENQKLESEKRELEADLLTAYKTNNELITNFLGLNKGLHKHNK